MQPLREFLCSIIKTDEVAASILARKSKPIISVMPNNNGKLDKVIKNDYHKQTFFQDFFWDLLGCDEFNPPNGIEFCITDDDCNPGENCKEGTCVVDPSHCVNTGCDEHHDCDENTGECIIVPECDSNDDCDQIAGGEMCVGQICKPPVLCLSAIPQSCPPTWICDGDACVKADCSPISDTIEHIQCCENSTAFTLNESACCTYKPTDPRCP
jgi:hypothetical protein